MAVFGDAHRRPDVIVIGGGPGGSTAATMLARKGMDVLLLERERFPRSHVGESLLPASIPIFDELGVLPAINNAGFLPKWGTTMVWGREREPWSWYFRETNRNNPHSYQVWRPQLDQMLLGNSRACGVEVFEGHRVVEVLFDGGRAVGVRYLDEDGNERIAEARFVVDASGQSGLLAHQLELRRWDPYFRNLAMYGYFDQAEPLPSPDSNNIFIESYLHGWFWNIPLHTGWTSVGCVVDSEYGQKAIGSGGIEAFLTDQIAQAPHLAGMLQKAQLVSGPFVVKDWSYLSDQFVGDGYILVGDAACFVDPLFSSGVHLALMSGVLAAAYVTSALQDAELGKAAATEYQLLYKKEYSQFRELAKLFYSSNRTVDSYFWEARRLLAADADMSDRQVFIRAVAGQPPQGYERAVMERGEAPKELLVGVSAVESERASRREWFLSVTGDSETVLSPIFNMAPCLSQQVKVQGRAVLGEGEFVWGHVLTSPSQPEGTRCSNMVASMVSLINGRNTVANILANLSDGVNKGRYPQIMASAMSALQILYIDGAIAEFRAL